MSVLSQRLLKFNEDLLPGGVQLKYGLMAENAFRFFRGTCHLFYEDLCREKHFPDSPLTWICGDLHLENFGSFKGNNRVVYFDLNDFDESALAPLGWEIARTVCSIFVAFSTLGIKPTEAKKTAKLFLKTYSDVLVGEKAYYIDPRTATGIVKNFMKAVKKRKESDLIDAISGRNASAGQIMIDHKTHFQLEQHLKEALMHRVSQWIQDTPEWPNHYMVRDAAFRVAGTGSVGLKRYMFTLQSTADKRKMILVEMKQARPSSLSPFNKVAQPSWTSEAARLIFIQRRMQNIPPALLSEIMFRDEPYVLQEMQPAADKIKFELIRAKKKDLEKVVRDMAMLAASAQIRSGGIRGSSIIDELAAFAKEKDWQESLLNYAMHYSKTVTADFRQFLSDYKKGAFYVNTEKTPDSNLLNARK